MKATYCTVEDLQKALEFINTEYYDNNIVFHSESVLPNKFRLQCKEFKKGHRIHRSYSFEGARPDRRSKNACWHVHGYFFDALFDINPNAVIRAGNKKITASEGNWQDWNVGSNMYPVYYSESCNCYQIQ